MAMNPEELKKARKKMDASPEQVADKLKASERFWKSREYGEVPIGPMLEYAVRWLLHIKWRPPKGR